MEKEGGCFFCGVEDIDACEKCDWAKYCSQHKTLHMDSQGKCFPYKVENIPGKGKCLVAGRDISPGEIVLQDTAAVISASTPGLVCLECLASIEPSSTCHRCNLPLCCSGPLHQVECNILRKGICPSIDRSSSLYLTVSVIRLLNVRQTEPGKWELVARLMDHLEEFRKLPTWDGTIQNILTNIGDHSRIASLAEVERTVGVLLTNAVSCRPVDGVERGHGLFPVFSVTSHSCVANTWRCVEDDSLTLRTTVQVPSGAELTTSYKSPAIGSVSRRPHFPSNWFFDCRCPRCSDPTELGTYMSALRCPTCPGILLPTHPLDYNSAWACSDCSRTMAASEAVQTTVLLYKMAVEAGEVVPNLERICKHLLAVVHKHHYILLQVKRDLVMLYGNAEGFAIRDLSLEQLERKMSLCEEYLAVMEVVEPGYSRWRGKMLEEFAMAKLERIRRKVEEGRLGKLEAMLEYRVAIKLIKEAGKCNHFDTQMEQKKFAERVKSLMF